MKVLYFPFWNIAGYDSAVSHTKSRECRIIQSLYVRDWGTSRLSQKQLPELWLCNRRGQGALLSEHPVYHCISHIQTSLAAVSTRHVHKSDLWSLVQYEEMRNMPSVTLWEDLGSHSCSMDQLFSCKELLCSWSTDAIQFPAELFKLTLPEIVLYLSGMV